MRTQYRRALLEPLGHDQHWVAPEGWAIHTVLSVRPTGLLDVILYQVITGKEARKMEAAA